jgi:hypothetical protein
LVTTDSRMTTVTTRSIPSVELTKCLVGGTGIELQAMQQPLDEPARITESEPVLERLAYDVFWLLSNPASSFAFRCA